MTRSLVCAYIHTVYPLPSLPSYPTNITTSYDS